MEPPNAQTHAHAPSTTLDNFSFWAWVSSWGTVRGPAELVKEAPPSGRHTYSHVGVAGVCSDRTYSGLAVLVKARRVVGCPVIAVMVSKSLSTCRMVNPESSAVAAMMRSGIDGPRC